MKQSLRDTTPFALLFGTWLLLGMAVILATNKTDLHLWFNQWHHPATDLFFRYATHLGEGLFAGIVILLAFVYKIRHGVMTAAAFLLSGGITQVLKRLVFNDIHRPSRVFEQLADLHFVEGVVMHKSYSFPSGHATAAFCIFLMLTFMTKVRSIQVFCFVMAILVGFSRVYLSQHFFEDIYAGSIIGTLVSLAVVAYLRDKAWGETGLVALADAKRKRTR